MSINTTTARKLVIELERFEQLKSHILRLLPDGTIPYGSKLWWEKEVLNGEEEIEKDKFKTYKTSDTLIEDLHKGV